MAWEERLVRGAGLEHRRKSRKLRAETKRLIQTAVKIISRTKQIAEELEGIHHPERDKGK